MSLTFEMRIFMAKSRNRRFNDAAMSKEWERRNIYTDFDRNAVDESDCRREVQREMIENLKAVQDIILQAIQTDSAEIFARFCQKTDSTKSLIHDKELLDAINAVQSQFSDNVKKNQAIAHLVFVCDHLIRRLNEMTVKI